MGLIKQPAKWQCPYCLKEAGVVGNWLAKVFGTRFHSCDFSNVKKDNDHTPVIGWEEKVDWEEVINKYIISLKINQAVLEAKLAKAPSTHALKVVRYPRGLALFHDKDDEKSPIYFLNHILYVDIEYVSGIDYILTALERRKEYTAPIQPSFAGIKLDPNINIRTRLDGEWERYIYPDKAFLRFHLVSGGILRYLYPKHVAGQMLAAANKMLKTGKSQIVDYVPPQDDDDGDSTRHSADDVPPDVASGK